MAFKKLLQVKTGAPVDMPESLTAILIRQHGAPVFYNTLPKTLNGQIILRKCLDKPRFIYDGFFKEPDRFVYSLTNGYIFGPLGVVYDMESRAYINESAQEWLINLNDSAYTNAINFPPITHLNGVTLSCLTNGADYGFYHFLFESLIKLYLYEPFIGKAKHVLLNGPAADWKIKWLSRTSIDTDKIIWVTNTGHYQCEQLIFSNKIVADQQVNPWCINGLKKLLNIKAISAGTISSKKTIWISRKGLGKREIEWQDELLSHFPEIEQVDLTSLSTDDTIQIMARATHIIAPHGAGLSNIYLCQPATRILELYPHVHAYQPYYKRISDLCGLVHEIAYLDFKDQQNGKLGLNTFRKILSNFLC